MNDNKKVQGIDSKIWELPDEIVLPINVFIYLANDRAYNNPQRLSKIQAFVDLVEHYLDSLQNEQDAALNIAKLSRRWNWTRPTVIAYVNNLKAMNAFEVEDSKERTFRLIRIFFLLQGVAKHLIAEKAETPYSLDQPSHISLPMKRRKTL